MVRNRGLSGFTSVVVCGLMLCAGCSRARVESMTHVNEGVVLGQQRQYLLAAEKMEKAATIDPTNEQAFWNLSMVLMEMHKYELAREAIQKAIAINDKAMYHEKLGTILIELSDWAGAKKAFEDAIKKDPSLYKGYFKLGQVSERLDDQQSALHYYTKAIVRGPRLVEAYRELGRLYGDLGYVDQATQVLQEALRVVQTGSEEEAEVHFLIGTVLHQQKRYDDAITEFRKAIQILPSHRDAMFSLGRAYFASGNAEEAKRFLQRYLTMSSGAPEHYIQAAQATLANLQGE